MKKFIVMLVLLIAMVVVAADNSDEYKSGNASTRYIWNSIAGDSATQAMYKKDTMNVLLGAAGADSLFFNLGPCPSNRIDTSYLGIVISGTDGGVGCSLFVSMSPYSALKRDYLIHVPSGLANNTGTVITDSLTGVTNGFYALANLNRYRGFNIYAKLYTYSGGNETGIKRVFISRDDK